MNLVCLSGGLASAYLAKIVIEQYEDVLLYFNDTTWEHTDLFRFLSDLERVFNKKIYVDKHELSLDDVIANAKFLPNNRVPFCSVKMKAELLQRFIKEHDDSFTLFFGIQYHEKHRAERISKIYSDLAKKLKKEIVCKFPLINDKVEKSTILKWLESVNIEQPYLYKLGFNHNNCSGACVRSTPSQWLKVLHYFPEVYAQREELEEYVREMTNKDVSFLKAGTLKKLREAEERKEKNNIFNFNEVEVDIECVGICMYQN